MPQNQLYLLYSHKALLSNERAEMKRLTITIPDELHRKISEIRGKRIADEARSVPMNEIVNELLCKALKEAR